MANQIRDLNTLHPKMRDLALKFLDECKKTWPGTAATVPAAPPSTTKTHA
ncbi:MAG: hypothetical protein FWH04_07850 [Oscillospiraceae bacterium]|nr:hypothetical protein [Oscillospiraceae bacterium]